MENKQGYDPSEFEADDYTTPQPDAGKSIRGYRIVIIILSVILVALSVLYFSIHRQQMVDNQLLQADRDSIQNDLGRLMTDYDGLRISNDSISAGLTLERERADSLMTRLKKERSWNLAKIKQYEKEGGTLRTIMKGYVKQIDSLNTLNKKLIKENVGFRKEISSAKLRADKLKAENDALKKQPIEAVVDEEEVDRRAGEKAYEIAAGMTADYKVKQEQDARDAYDSIILAGRSITGIVQSTKLQFRKLPDDQRESAINQLVHTLASAQGEVSACL